MYNRIYRLLINLIRTLIILILYNRCRVFHFDFHWNVLTLLYCSLFLYVNMFWAHVFPHASIFLSRQVINPLPIKDLSYKLLSFKGFISNPKILMSSKQNKAEQTASYWQAVLVEAVCT